MEAGGNHMGKAEGGSVKRMKQTGPHGRCQAKRKAWAAASDSTKAEGNHQGNRDGMSVKRRKRLMSYLPGQRSAHSERRLTKREGLASGQS